MIDVDKLKAAVEAVRGGSTIHEAARANGLSRLVLCGACAASGLSVGTYAGAETVKVVKNGRHHARVMVGMPVGLLGQTYDVDRTDLDRVVLTRVK